MAKRQTTTPKQLAHLEKERRALDMRRAGKRYDEIAEALGYHDRSGARRLVAAAMGRVQRENAEEALGLELDRLDTMHGALWPEALAGDRQTVETLAKLSERRAKLMGLDKPSAQVRAAVEQMLISIMEAGRRVLDDESFAKLAAAVAATSGVTVHDQPSE